MLTTRRDTAVIVVFAVIFVAASVQARPGYLLTAPKVLLPGSEEICVSFHDVDFDVELNVQLRPLNTNLEDAEYMSPVLLLFQQGNGHCFALDVPSNIPDNKAFLVVWGGSRSPADNYTIAETSKKVAIGTISILTLIQTDKPIYKPGQTVKFRILGLMQDLKPRYGSINEVWVEDPNGVRISQWTDVTTRKGLASLELPMSPEPVLGKWKIKSDIDGKRDEQVFKVDEYVLPKYEITITPPSYLPVNAETITGEVCAKYTYGEPVVGQLQLNVSLRSAYGEQRPSVNFTVADFNGCYSFRADAREMRLTNDRYAIWNLKLVIEAEVTEAATGVILTERDDRIEVTRQVLTIDVAKHSRSYFKPGLPYSGKGVVTKPDGQPAEGELIQVQLRNYQHDLDFTQNFTTDSKGEFLFTLPGVDITVPSFSVQVHALNHTSQRRRNRYIIYDPNTYHNVRQWYSPSGSFLQVEPVEGRLPCRGTLQFPVKYTTESNTNFRFYYQVMSRGNIIASGHKHHHFQHHGVEQPHLPVRDEPFTVNRRLAVSPPHTPRPDLTQENIAIDVLPHVAEFPLDIEVTPKMSPKLHLLVYYVREDGETVADSVDVDITKCFDNEVEMQFDAIEKYPGEDTTVQLRADPGSLCAYGVVDKSVTLLGGNNQINLAQIFEDLKQYELDSSSGIREPDNYCQLWIEQNEGRKKKKNSRQPGPPGAPGQRFTRPSWGRGSYYSDYEDTMTAFKNLATVSITDLVLETRPCKERMMFYRARGGGGAGPMPMPLMSFASVKGPDDGRISNEPSNEIPTKQAKAVLELRNYFPETWLWDLEEVGDTGEAEVRTQLPHTITQWIGSAFCTNENTGLGISEATAIKGFQPFFVSFTLPYSVVRGEKVLFPITVFNYLSECLVIELNLKRGNDFSIVGSRNEELCVCGSESRSHRFAIVASQIGDVNITVKAESKENNGVCGNGVSMSSQIGVRDAVTKSLIVEPEGIEEEYTHSAFVCPDEGQTHRELVDLSLPTNLVADSARAKVTAIGDVMGPSLSGLDKLIKLPTGCGEQNMLNFAPNIFVMQYLTQTGQLGGAIESKAKEFMVTGYQRELNYKRIDNSYSAFGNSDAAGSMWLTAFVVRCFAQARPFIYIDPADLTRSVDWFRNKQLENGCFPQVGRVLHKDMKGGLAEGSENPATLTAFVLISMLEANVEISDPAVHSAIQCLNSQTVTDTYTIALMAYAYTLWDKTSPQRHAVMDRLEELATREEGVVYWKKATQPAPTPGHGWTSSSSHRTPAANVEMTAYALMAYLTGGGINALGESLPIVQWLSKQRNAYGGFSSTQDTVVALQALSHYAAIAYGDNMDLIVQAEGSNLDVTFTVDGSNSLVLQQEDVPVPNSVTLSAVGTGCVFIQTHVKYNVYNATIEEPVFRLNAQVGRSTRDDATCKQRNINICTKYTGSDDASNMVIVAAKMVSGWIPDKMSLTVLEKDLDLQLKRFEVDKNMVHFYFDELTDEYKCFAFTVEQDIEVQDPKPGFIQVYDYYETEKNMMEPYKISLTCGTKEELPHITLEEWQQIQEGDQSEIGQVRLPVELPPLIGEPRIAQPGPIIEDDIILPACAVCYNNMPADFVDLFCAASYAYKTSIKQRDGQFNSLRVTSNLRPRPKERINFHAGVAMQEACTCPVIFSGVDEGKVLVLTTEEIMEPAEGRARLDLLAEVRVVPLSRDVELAIKNSRC